MRPCRDSILSLLPSIPSSASSGRPWTKRILTALANPCCTMLAHVSGRLLRPGTVCPRLGGHPEIRRRPPGDHGNQRQPLPPGPTGAGCAGPGIGDLISINPDAHSLEGLDDVNYGVMIARKGWLAPEDVLNTYPPAEVAKSPPPPGGVILGEGVRGGGPCRPPRKSLSQPGKGWGRSA